MTVPLLPCLYHLLLLPTIHNHLHSANDYARCAAFCVYNRDAVAGTRIFIRAAAPPLARASQFAYSLFLSLLLSFPSGSAVMTRHDYFVPAADVSFCNAQSPFGSSCVPLHVTTVLTFSPPNAPSTVYTRTIYMQQDTLRRSNVATAPTLSVACSPPLPTAIRRHHALPFPLVRLATSPRL